MANKLRSPKNTVIDLQQGRKTYNTGTIEFEALRGVDLKVESGEYVAIVGPSGSGKSTLMNILGCLDNLTEGNYRLADKPVDEMTEEELAFIRNVEIGFVFQQFHLLPSLTAQQNVELPLAYRKGDKNRHRASLQALGSVGLADRMKNRPNEMSGGQQQRVAIARALVGDPSLILADEPTGNLDSSASEEIMALFDRLHAEGRTVVLITHDHEVAERANRIVTVKDGLISSDQPSGLNKVERR